MRLLLTLATLVVCLAAALGPQQRSSASKETERHVVPDSPAGSRLFLEKAESERAASMGILPEQTRSILYVPHKMRYGQFVWNDIPAVRGPLAIRVDLNEQLVSVFRNGHEIGVAVILYGVEGHETPPGHFPIMAKIEDHRSATYDNAPMPYTLRLTTDGVAIHGSDVRRGAATHGCIGVPVQFARSLFDAAKVGDVVQIVDAAAPLAAGFESSAATIS